MTEKPTSDTGAGIPQHDPQAPRVTPDPEPSADDEMVQLPSAPQERGNWWETQATPAAQGRVYQTAIPAGFKDKSRSFSGDPAMAGAMIGKEEQLLKDRQELNRANYSLANAEKVYQLTGLQAGIAERGERIAQLETQKAERDAYIKGKLGQFERHRDMIKNAPVEQTVYEGSTGKTVLAAIAMAFGQYGAGMTGGPNMAAQMIQRANQTHVDEQLRKLKEGAQGVGDDERAMWEEMRREGNSPEQIREQMVALANERSAMAAEAQGAQRELQHLTPYYQGVSLQLRQDSMDRIGAVAKEHAVKYTQEYDKGREGGWIAPKAEKTDLRAYQQELNKQGVPEEEAAIDQAESVLEGMRTEGEGFVAPGSENPLERAWMGVKDWWEPGSSEESYTPAQRDQRRKFSQVKGKLLSARAGSARSEQEVKDTVAEIAGITNPEDLRRYIQGRKREADARRRSAAAAFAPEVVYGRESRKQQLDRAAQRLRDPVPSHMPPKP